MNGDNLEAESVRRAILAQHSARHMKGPKQTLPNGTVISLMPYVGFRHPGETVGKMLADPTSIMKRECVKPGHKYAWYSRRDSRTSTKIKSKVARAVSYDEIDTSNPEAEVIEIVTPSGTGVVWENMLLCELSPRANQRYYVAYEQWAIAQMVQQPEAFANEVETATKGAYKGEFEVKDKLEGR